MPETHFYFASTPLHVLLSSAIALSKPEIQHVILLIDQPNIESNFYHEVLTQWASSPFVDVFLSEGKISGITHKIQSRKKTFARIKEMTEKYNPTRVFTGSDKRLEFQYCMHLLNEDTKGIYIDEGTFSYILPSLTKRISHSLFDSLGKKIVYGNWYKSTPFTGGSRYITDILAAHPSLVHKGLATKAILPLEENLLEQTTLKTLAESILSKQHFSLSAVEKLDVIVSLPHQSIFADEVSMTHWKALIAKLISLNKSIAVKYHPRDDHEDILELNRLSTLTTIPRKIMFEALLPGLQKNCHIIGDFSSVLLNAKWLKPSTDVNAIIQRIDKKSLAFIKLYKQLNISTFTINDIDALVKKIEKSN